MAIRVSTSLLSRYLLPDMAGYQSWRRLGDVISTIFALGYHEETESDRATPPFLKNLRRAAFARAYSADKNLSIFLGRPPRLLQKFCKFQLPSIETETRGDRSDSAVQDDVSSQVGNGGHFAYMMDSKWSAIWAALKERVLDMRRDASQDERIQMAQLVSRLRLLALLLMLSGIYKPMQKLNG